MYINIYYYIDLKIGISEVILTILTMTIMTSSFLRTKTKCKQYLPRHNTYANALITHFSGLQSFLP